MRTILLSFLVLLSFLLPLQSVAAAGQGEARELEYARKLYADGVYDLAAEQCRSLRRDFPESQRLDEVLQMEGECWFALGEYEEARRAWQRLAINHPQSSLAPGAFGRTADCLVMLGRRDEAAHTLRRVAEYYADSPEAASSLLRSEELWPREEIEQRREILQQLLRAYDRHEASLEARRRLALMDLAAGQHSRALRELERLLRLAPAGQVQAAAAIDLANLLAEDGRLADAQRSVDGILQDYNQLPQRALLRVTSASLHIQAGEYSTTAERVTGWLRSEGANQDDPALQDSLRLLAGNAYAFAGTWDRAVEAYASVSQPDADSDFRLAWCEARQGNLSAAFSLYLDLLKRATAGKTEARLLPVVLSELQRISRVLPGAVLPWPEVGAPLCALPEDVGVPVELIDGLIAAGETAVAATLLHRYGSRPGPLSDDLALCRIRLGVRTQDYAAAAAAWREFTERYPLSPLRPQADALYVSQIRRHAESAGLNERLLGLLVRQNQQENPQQLALEFAGLYLDYLRDVAQARQQYELAAKGSDVALRTEAEWGLVRCVLEEETVDDAASVQALGRFLQDYPRSSHALEAELKLDELTYSPLKLSGVEEVDCSAVEQRVLHWQQVYASQTAGSANAMRAANRLLRLSAIEAQCTEGASRRDAIEFVLAWGDSLRLRDALSPEASLALGVAFELMGEAVMAAGEYRRLIARDTDSAAIAEAELRLAALDVTQDQERLDLLERLRSRSYYHPAADEARRLIAGLYLREGRTQDALAIYNELQQQAQKMDSGIDIVPDPSRELSYNLGVAYHEMGESQHAIEAFRQYLAGAGRDPRAADALYRTALILAAKGEKDRAILYLKNQILVFPDDPRTQAAMRELARLYVDSDQFGSALTVLERLGAARSPDPQLRYEWITALYRHGRLDQGRDEMRSYLHDFDAQVDSDTVKAAFNLAKGQYLAAHQDYDEAAVSLRHVLKHFIDTRFAPTASLTLAQVLMGAGNKSEAMEELERLQKRWPGSEQASRGAVMRGHLYRAEGDTQKAIIEFRKAIDECADPDSRRFAYNNLIVCYKELGFYDGALQTIRQYLDEFPQSDDAVAKRIDIGLLQKEMGNLDQAREQLRAQLPEADVEQEAAIQFYVGECAQLKGEYRQAILEYMKVPYLGSETRLDWDVTALYQAGQCWEQLGEPRKAVDLYQQIIQQRGPGSSYGKAAQDRINSLRYQGRLGE